MTLNLLSPLEGRYAEATAPLTDFFSEGALTTLCGAGKSDAYDSLQEQTRGRVLTEADYEAGCDSTAVSSFSN